MSVKKAYENISFLKSASARSIRILAEYMEPLHRFERYHVYGTIVLMGSSRVIDKEQASRRLAEARKRRHANPDDAEALREYRKARHQMQLARYYEDARIIARDLTRWSLKQPRHKRVLICTGAGPGIMEAGNRGARDARGSSIGLGISMTLHEPMNRYVPRKFRFIFHYFFMRKLWFMYLAKAVLFFPGGFGTMDEIFELLTLKQTGKIKRPLPIILYGTEFWRRVIAWDYLYEAGLIGVNDREIFVYCDSPGEVLDYLLPILEKLED